MREYVGFTPSGRGVRVVAGRVDEVVAGGGGEKGGGESGSFDYH